jgi:uncharacterized protein
VSARVAWISYTPVKATALHLLDEVDLLESGPKDDRRFYFITERGRLVNNKDVPPLQLVRADYDGPADTLTLRFADGAEVTGVVQRGEEVMTHFHRRPRPARLVEGPWATAVSRTVGEPVRLVEPALTAPDRGRGGAATFLGRRSLGALADVLGVETVDARRFRMNFGIDGIDAHAEDSWTGRRLRVGEAVVVPQGHVGRCAITTQDPDTAQVDLDTLKALADYRGRLERTEPLPFGIHAAVAEPGRVRVGDPVALV